MVTPAASMPAARTVGAAGYPGRLACVAGVDALPAPNPFSPGPNGPADQSGVRP